MRRSKRCFRFYKMCAISSAPEPSAPPSYMLRCRPDRTNHDTIASSRATAIENRGSPSPRCLRTPVSGRPVDRGCRHRCSSRCNGRYPSAWRSVKSRHWPDREDRRRPIADSAKPRSARRGRVLIRFPLRDCGCSFDTADGRRRRNTGRLVSLPGLHIPPLPRSSRRRLDRRHRR